MLTNNQKSLIETKMEDSEYKKRHNRTYNAFKLEAQILYAIEKKGWTYSDLAKVTHTNKSNISRDLRAGGILSASFSRITRIAEALEMKLVTLLIPQEKEQYLLQRIEDIVRDSLTSTEEIIEVTPPILEFTSQAIINDLSSMQEKSMETVVVTQESNVYLACL
ncbi:MAG: hypothetical protein Q7R35_02575 [Elusimicrobiota bacterium]|nr:hypothetical protein [Elusimicrobiota bacterium]